MITEPSKQLSSIGPRDVRPMTFDNDTAKAAIAKNYKSLAKLGIGFDSKELGKLMKGYGFDSLQPAITTASVGAPIQFLQEWLPGYVEIVSAVRKIDDLLGINIVGSWEDEEIVQGVRELTGVVQPYGDYTNTALANWNATYERRSVERFESGLHVARLEEARAARARLNSAQGKREGVAVVLEIQRNAIGFYGYNSGLNRTYGFLTDPNLPAYITVAATGTGATTTWSTKTYLNITADLRAAFVQLRTQSLGMVDPMKTPITLALPLNCVDYLSVTSDFGISVADWLKTTYPNVRVENAPELDSANGGANVFYLYAEKIQDTSTDGGQTMIQVVQAKTQLLGVAQQAKAMEEAYSNATAGVLVKRPFAVVRYTGI